MAYTATLTPPTIYHDGQPAATAVPMSRHPSRPRFVAELSQCLFDFVIQLLPTAEEMAVKEDVRKLLERLIRTIEPDSRLLSFGSTANGFSLRNSDMDLCCLIDSDEKLNASNLVTMLGDLLERGLPLGIACDIGFENRLALENTRLLMCYAMIDPTRVRTLVLFLKVWSKRRKINSPYTGTLSSYGYVLLVIYFLVHVKNPPVLPNLQQMPPLRPISKEDTHLGGHNTWFFDDVELLRQRWHSENTETVAELLIDFFRYYSRDFLYNTSVVSIRAGLLKKESKGWQSEYPPGRYNDARERNRLCIEDPFETDYNVARCVTKDGLYTIRGEFMRAGRVLAGRPERAIMALADLCAERPDDPVTAPGPSGPRLANPPPQTPYSVGNQSMRPKGTDRLSPPADFSEAVSKPVTIRAPPPDDPPEHMAPKRGKWTSPPPPDAPPAAMRSFEDQLENGLFLATAPTEAREPVAVNNDSSSSNSEISSEEDRSDVDHSDDVTSVRSFSESTPPPLPSPARRSSWVLPEKPSVNLSVETPPRLVPLPRGRFKHPIHAYSPPTTSKVTLEHMYPSPQSVKRSISGPGRSAYSPMPIAVPLPPSPDTGHHLPQYCGENTIFYQTGTNSPRRFVYPLSPSSPSPLLSSHNVQHIYSSPSPTPPNLLSASLSHRSMTPAQTPTPTPRSEALHRQQQQHAEALHRQHRHGQSNAAQVSPTPSSHSPTFGQNHHPQSGASFVGQNRGGPPSPHLLSGLSLPLHMAAGMPGSPRLGGSPLSGSPHMGGSPLLANGLSYPPGVKNINAEAMRASPTPSSNGYAASSSRSPSPHALLSPNSSPPREDDSIGRQAVFHDPAIVAVKR
ncbi:hypothetical protein CYLTODRAFT_412395 [Cylindrobasidium torrendii FP15055 ss-10]|uniref:polynucleotide adenylyltransferase n=1 Tax=Cylindrobasidium torrendii FP15055 ss-10 TaxID=1314674 RepID=A0A0D7B5A8_9AGAR|nr:hypothetical protein CYLTODRAFT_412395 [Cylindrobasidium torrendii FP15055 ss-10]